MPGLHEREPQDHSLRTTDDALDDFVGWVIDPEVGWTEIPQLLAQDLMSFAETGCWSAGGEDDAAQIESLEYLVEFLLGVAAEVRERVQRLRERVPALATDGAGQ